MWELSGYDLRKLCLLFASFKKSLVIIASKNLCQLFQTNVSVNAQSAESEDIGNWRSQF